VAYIEAHKASFGVEPICEVLEIAPSTYYAARNRTPCARAVRDAELRPEIERVYTHNRSVYGPLKTMSTSSLEFAFVRPLVGQLTDGDLRGGLVAALCSRVLGDFWGAR
jgi:putative transposase